MDEVTWGQLWTRWIGEYRETRTQRTPIGYYDLADMREAFDAGRKAEDEYALREIINRITAVLPKT